MNYFHAAFAEDNICQTNGNIFIPEDNFNTNFLFYKKLCDMDTDLLKN